jgi:hypothetical protein
MAKSQRSSGCYSPRGNARALARGKLPCRISSPLRGEEGGGGKGAVCKVADLKTRFAEKQPRSLRPELVELGRKAERIVNS